MVWSDPPAPFTRRRRLLGRVIEAYREEDA